MSITKVLETVGDDKLSYQVLGKSLLKFKHNKKNDDIEFTFCTGKGNEFKEAIIVWVDKEDLNVAVKKVQANGV